MLLTLPFLFAIYDDPAIAVVVLVLSIPPADPFL